MCETSCGCGCNIPIENIIGARGAKGESGDRGTDGFLFDPDAIDVTFFNDPIGTLPTVNDALMYLLYKTPVINSFGITAAGYDLNNLEKGTVIPNGLISLNYNISQVSKPITSKTISPNIIGQISGLVGSVIDAMGTSNNRTYTLSVSDGDSRGNISSSASIIYKDRIFFGVSAATSLTPTQVINLSSELRINRPSSKVFDCSTSGGAFPYIAVPATSGYIISKFEYGATTVTFIGTPTTLTVNGQSVSYMVYRAPEKLNGSAIEFRFS